MSSPQHPDPDAGDPRLAPFAPPSGDTGGVPEAPPWAAAGAGGSTGRPSAPWGPPTNPYATGAPPYGAPAGPGGPYGSVPWQAPQPRRGLSGGKIALVVGAALVALALLVAGVLALLGALGSSFVGVGNFPGVGGQGSGSGPFTYGDDAVLDDLWDRCEAGDGGACDDLFWDSPVSSEYEEFGNTCGGRFEEGPWSCAGEI